MKEKEKERGSRSLVVFKLKTESETAKKSLKTLGEMRSARLQENLSSPSRGLGWANYAAIYTILYSS
jgi:hypothetical protein